MRRGWRSLLGTALLGWLVIGLGVMLAAGPPSYRGRVVLQEQNPQGNAVENGAETILKYSLAGPTFDFALSAARLDKGTSYSLILSREPDVQLPARYDVVATGWSDSGGGLSLSGSHDFGRDLLAGKFLLIPTAQPPDKPLTYAGKYLFAAGTVAHDDTDSDLICGVNLSPGPSDALGLQVGNSAIDFSLWGISGPGALTAGNAEQPLEPFKLSELLASKPVLLVNGAFT
jgi:hypothetical protein